jgi:nucleoside-diphosphate-sugar epimerase
MPHLLCFGFGFSARALAPRLMLEGWTISATSRDDTGQRLIAASGAGALPFPAPPHAFDGVTHILISAPPGEAGDPVLAAHGAELARRARQFAWVGYLSTTGVYGDRGGDVVDEDSPLAPTTDRGRRRLAAERSWLALGLPLHIFRLAGIYGPGRNQLVSMLDGSTRRVVKPGQIFSRIHVEDIVGVLLASIAKPNPGRAYNVCDDEPCPPQDVVAFAAKLLDRPVPPEIAFDKADLSPMARSFYAESKRVSNRRIKEELGYRLIYPTYRDGLTALARQLPAPSP